MIRVTKIFRFEAAHMLYGYQGPCSSIHGHSYELHVTVKGQQVRERHHPLDGMVVEFSDLKKIVNELIVSRLDHALIIPESAPPDLVAPLQMAGHNVVITPYQPTCENLLDDFAAGISSHLGPSLKLQHLKLYETDTSYAEWSVDDV